MVDKTEILVESISTSLYELFEFTVGKVFFTDDLTAHVSDIVENLTAYTSIAHSVEIATNTVMFRYAKLSGLPASKVNQAVADIVNLSMQLAWKVDFHNKVI